MQNGTIMDAIENIASSFYDVAVTINFMLMCNVEYTQLI